MITLHNGDCLEIMKNIEDQSIDMILCDLPYGTTTCKWDNVIPFELLWEQYKRIIKDNGAIVLFGSEPFSSKLRMSNLSMYRYDWIWQKTGSSTGYNAKKMPIKIYENVLIFYKKLPTYNPQMTKGKPYDKTKYNGRKYAGTCIGGGVANRKKNNGTRYPINILIFSKNWRGQDQLHPTQKPVALLEYFIKTYTKENELVLDNCMGSGSTGIACLNTNRKFIGIEKDQDYFQAAQKRLEDHQKQLRLW